jgi:hypothetical protein
MNDRKTRPRRNRFQLVLVPAVSAALLAFGCDRPTASTRICIDPQGRRLPDDQCRNDRYPSSFHHWYYVSGGGVPIGAFVHGGSSFRSSASRSGSVSRGGFGSSAHASGSAGG